MDKSKKHQATGLVECLRHFAVVPHVVIKFGDSWGGGTIVDGGGNGSNWKNTSAEDALILKVVIFVANDFADAACPGMMHMVGQMADSHPLAEKLATLVGKGGSRMVVGLGIVGAGDVGWRMEILSCMQFVLHAGQVGVFFLNNFALAEQLQNSEEIVI
jgi:hypothetical protein